MNNKNPLYNIIISIMNRFIPSVKTKHQIKVVCYLGLPSRNVRHYQTYTHVILKPNINYLSVFSCQGMLIQKTGSL